MRHRGNPFEFESEIDTFCQRGYGGGMRLSSAAVPFFVNVKVARRVGHTTRGCPIQSRSVRLSGVGRRRATDYFSKSSSITDVVLQSNDSILRAFRLKSYYIGRMPHPYPFFAQGWDSLDIYPGTYFL